MKRIMCGICRCVVYRDGSHVKFCPACAMERVRRQKAKRAKRDFSDPMKDRASLRWAWL